MMVKVAYVGDFSEKPKRTINHWVKSEATRPLTKQQRWRNNHREELKAKRREEARRYRQAKQIKTDAAIDDLR